MKPNYIIGERAIVYCKDTDAEVVAEFDGGVDTDGWLHIHNDKVGADLMDVEYFRVFGQLPDMPSEGELS